MRTAAVEHETEEKPAGHGPEQKRQVEAMLPAVLSGASPAFLDPGTVLGLQRLAGNAAVAGLIERSRAAEEPPSSKPPDKSEALPQDAEAEFATMAAETADPKGEQALSAAEPGVPIEERAPPPITDVSRQDPSAALATVGALPPAQLLHSLSGVSNAANQAVGDEHQRLVANPPQRSRLSGTPSIGETTPWTRAALVETPVRSIPQVPEGVNVDPAIVQRTRANVLDRVKREHGIAQREAGQPLGEKEIGPSGPTETLRAAITGTPGSEGTAGTSDAPGEGDKAASIIAREEHGAEIRNAVAGGLASLATERREYQRRAGEERARAGAEMTKLERAHAAEQGGERAAAKGEVLVLRSQWATTHDELLATAHAEANGKAREASLRVAQEKNAAHQEASAQEQGQRAPAGGGLLGLAASAANSLFNRAKQAVQSTLERARRTIAGVIHTANTALTAIGDRVVLAFSAIRDRFRRAIVDRISAAKAAVNKLALGLMHATQAALNKLGAGLSGAIALWHRGTQLAIDGVRNVVRGAIQFAKGAISAFGAFAGLVGDIAANPVQWIANLAAAARDGIRNHLWPDLKTAVQGWFNDKIHAILGLSSTVWSLLRRGGITIAQAASFAWEGIKSLIPQTIIWVLIEKLVALIVPAAAAVMLIIQALQAAWGSLGRIIQAFDAFLAFLKGVRWGKAGALFGKALGAGAVAVIEFISQFVLQRLIGAAGTVAGKLRSLAKRIGLRLSGVGSAIGRGSGSLGRGLKARAKASGRVAATMGTRLTQGEREVATGISAEARRLEGRFGSTRVSEPSFAEQEALGHHFATARDFTIIEPDGTRAVRHGPLNPGPLEREVADTFRSASYTARTLGRPLDLYRVYSDPARRLAPYWSRTPPSGPLQSTIDSALLRQYGNLANRAVHIRVPASETVFEGYSSEQGALMGGGSQVYLVKVDPSWVIE